MNRRHDNAPWPGRRPVRAAWAAQQGARSGRAIERDHSDRSRIAKHLDSGRTEMKTTASNLIQWAGVSATVAGMMYVLVGLLHPFVSHHGGLSSVTSDVWVLTHSLTIGVSFFGLLGSAVLYARQVEEVGWLGLVGFLLFSLWLVLVPGFTFFEALILPLLAIDAPTFAESFLGIFTGTAAGTQFGALATVWTLMGPMYMLGALLFGIATLRAGILSRWAAGVFGFGAVSSLAFALLPPALEPLAAVPGGGGVAWLGHARLSQRGGGAALPGAPR